MKNSIETELAEFQTEFNGDLDHFFNKKIAAISLSEEKKVWEEIKDYILNGGKRLRPFLLFKMIKETRGQIEGLTDIMMGYELLHNSTLAEDDIIDQHSTRREKPTLPITLRSEQVNGEHATVIAAGLIRCAALELIQHANTNLAFKLECTEAYNRISTAVNKGQILDLLWSNKLDISESDLLFQINQVTACFFEEIFKVGCRKSEHKNTWAEIGRNLGIAFQLSDDLMDIDSEKNKGRQVGSDIYLGKATPLMIYAYNQLQENEKERFRGSFGQPTIKTEEMEWMINLLETTGAIEHVRQLIQTHINEIDSKLNNLNVTKNDHWMHQIKKFIIERIT